MAICLVRYNRKYLPAIDCSLEEKEIGLSEVRETVAHVVYYHEVHESLLNCLEEFNN